MSKPKILIKIKQRPVIRNIIDDKGIVHILDNMEGKYLEHDGEQLNAAIIYNFCDIVGVDHEKIWNDIQSLDKYDEEDKLEISDGLDPKLLTGAHPSLKYRGNKLARSKIWLQTDYDLGCKRYRYTDWQWRVAPATRRLESMPSIDSATDNINKFMAQGMNHVIGTVYKNGKDNIGAHSDKDDDFTPGTGFIVIKLGEARRFQFTTPSGHVFFSEKLPAGTAVVVGSDANKLTKHAVPPVDTDNPSGSLVWRNIGTTIPWPTVRAKISSANYKA